MALVAGEPLPFISYLRVEFTTKSLQPTYRDDMTILMIKYIAGLLHYLCVDTIIFQPREEMHLVVTRQVNRLPSLLSSVFTQHLS